MNNFDFVEVGGSRLPGLPDDLFVRGKIPMTKLEVRTLTLCQARIQRASTVWDVGAGSGSLAVEAALIASEGLVFAVEKNLEAVELIQLNASRFGLNNLRVVHGCAPEVLEHLPSPDRILIGGSGGRLVEILSICHEKLKKNGLLVLNAVTLDTLYQATVTLEGWGYNVKVTGIQISRLERIGKTRMWKALNPVNIIVAAKEGWYEG